MGRFKKAQKKWRKNNPWSSAYYGAKYRCKNHKYYAGRGIKMLLTLGQVKFLCSRDKASLMKFPSIDRINGKGNYELSNCRFIEMEENREPQEIIMYKIFKSAGDAGRYLKGGMAVICHCANRDRRNKTYKGFSWVWKKDLSHNLLTGGK